MLRPFVFRRYIDFSVIQSLRNMKGMIAREVRRRGLKDNIKLGAGGIREIEFIVQVFQLIRGGREPSLQSRSLLPTLSAIEQLHLLPEGDAQTLRDSYLFLRRLENLLQSINDEQTQTLPGDELNRARLAWGMRVDDWAALTERLEAHMAGVRRIFNDLIGDDESESQDDALSEHWRELWQDAHHAGAGALKRRCPPSRGGADCRFPLRTEQTRHWPTRSSGAGSSDAASAERCLLPRGCAGAAVAHDAAAERDRHAYHLP